MPLDRWFKFVAKPLNDQLLALVAAAEIPWERGKDERICYRSEDEEAFEELLAQVRGSIFPKWQVLSSPEDWVPKYRKALEDRGIDFQEELNNGALEFLIPGTCRPHHWKIA